MNCTLPGRSRERAVSPPNFVWVPLATPFSLKKKAIIFLTRGGQLIFG